MVTQDIRLRLAIRRHGMPEVKLVWPCARSSDVTIANLLVAVNEVVPLESSDWGLEDYVVELTDGQGGSYECLHFQPVAQALKDEDRVIIRSLLTDDLRRRRLSGRHQISTDGKHLVDGVAFGRPWLRTPRDRPALELPPRKRARIGEQEMAEPGNLLLLEGPSGAGAGIRVQSFFDDADFDEDFEPGEEDDDDDDVDESSGQSDEDMEDSSQELSRELELLKESADHSDSSSDESDKEEVVDSAPLGMNDRLEALEEEEDYASAQSSNECSVEHLAAIRGAYPLLSFSTIEKELVRQKQDLRKTYNALKSTTDPSLSFDEMMDRMVMGLLEQAASSPVQADRIDVFGRKLPSHKPLIEEIDSDDDADSSTSDSSSSEETSSDDISSDEDDSDEDTSDFVNKVNSDSDDDSSDSSSDDSSDSSSGVSNNEVDSTVSKPSNTVATIVNHSAPHQGQTRTQKRNARRRKAKLLKQQGDSTADLKEAEFLARKAALLGALSEEAVHIPDNEPPLVNGDGGQTPNRPQSEVLATPDIESAKRRARVDMGAGRRMLFGALGLKNPKSKAEEEGIKQKLMKDVKPLNNAGIIEVVDDRKVTQVTEDDTSSDDWRSRITYRAVECCHEGMVLSEPPFPFVQRWDPQQQYGSMRKRKRQSQTYNDDSYVEEGSGLYTEQVNGAQDLSTKYGGNRSKKRKSDGGQDSDSTKVNGNTDETAMNGANDYTQDMEDLPGLPEDLSSLATLERGAAKEGMIITWKQLSYSKETQWQPVIASVTAEVLPGSDESSLDVRLAFRDREYKEKLYDEKTGQRIYEKFEVPDFEEDEENDDEDDGHRTISWDEMTEPKIVREVSPWISQNGET